MLDLRTIGSLASPELRMGSSLERPGIFATTQWGVVVECQSNSPAAETALAELCATYWPPIYAYIRRRGYTVEDAEDLTQDFFARVLRKDWLNRADPERGKFRAFVLTSLKHFLGDAKARAEARKRGGDFAFVTLDDAAAEASYLAVNAADLTPEKAFDVRWAKSLVEQALTRLSEAYAAEGKAEMFAALKQFLHADAALSYHEVAKVLGVSLGAVKTNIHRLRQRYGQLLREEIARTVADPADVDVEISYLCSIL